MLFNCSKFNLEHISTVEQVQEFTRYLVEDLKVNIHPDNDFAEYIELNTGKQSFNAEEIIKGNSLMEECFKVCEVNSISIYDLMSNILFKH